MKRFLTAVACAAALCAGGAAHATLITFNDPGVIDIDNGAAGLNMGIGDDVRRTIDPPSGDSMLDHQGFQRLDRQGSSPVVDEAVELPLVFAAGDMVDKP